MIIFLFGKDTYRSRQRLKEIVRERKENSQNNLDLTFLEGGSLNYRDLKDRLQQRSMFSNERLVVIKNSLSNKEFRDDFLKESEKWEETKNTILFYEEGSPNKTKLLKFLKKESDECKEFKLLKGKELRKWTRKTFEEKGVKIKRKALSTFTEFVGNDLWRASNEIDKLSSYKEKLVKESDVRKMVNPKIEPEIFKTIDALVEKNKKKALKLIYNHMDEGNSPLYLLHMINYQVRNLLVVKDLKEKGRSYSEIQKEADLHPYVVKKSFRQAKKFSLSRIKKIYHRIFEADLAIKTGKKEPEAAIEFLVAQI